MKLIYSISGCAVIAYLVTLCLRIFYPYPLWLIEGDIYTHVCRLSEGAEIYPAKFDFRFIPLIYTPLFYYLAIPFHYLLPGIEGLRILSLLAVIGTFAAAVLILKRAGAPVWAVAVCLGLLACISPNFGGQWEQIKVDGLMVTLVLWGGILISGNNISRLQAFIGGLLLALAFYSKQTAAPFIVAAFLFLLIGKRERLLWFSTGLFGLLLVGGYFFYLHSGPGFLVYTVAIPLKQKLYPLDLIKDLQNIWLRLFPVILLVSATSYYVYKKYGGSQTVRLLLYFLPASFFAYALPRIKLGGYTFNFLPFGVVCSILAAWVMGVLFNVEAKRKATKRLSAIMAPVLVILQFTLLLYNPLQIIPNRDNYRMNADYVSALKDLDGEVYIPVRHYFGHLAGCRTYASHIAIVDVVTSGYLDGYPEELCEMFIDGKIDYLLIPVENIPNIQWMPEEMAGCLHACGCIINHEDYEPNTNVLIPPLKLYKIDYNGSE